MKIFLVFLLFSQSFYSQAYAANDSNSLNWSDCVSKALNDNYEIRAAKDSLSQAQGLEDSAGAGYYPQLSISINSSQSYISSGTQNVEKSNSAQLNLNQNIFSGFLDKSKNTQTQLNTQTARAELKIVELKILFNLKQTYASLVYAQQSLVLAEKILKRRTENQQIVELRFNSGRENKGSVLLSDAYLEQSTYDKISIQESLQNARAQLNNIIGVDVNEEISVQDLAPIKLLEEGEVKFSDLIKQTPQYEQLISKENSALVGIQIARSSFFPTLDLTANVGKFDNNYPLMNDKWNIGLSLTIPLWNGGKDSSAVKVARAQWQESYNTRHAEQAQLLTKLKKSYRDLYLAVKKVNVDEKFLKAAQTRAEIARNKYNNGLMTFEDWDLVENDLILREKTVLQSVRDQYFSQAMWEQSAGLGVKQ